MAMESQTQSTDEKSKVSLTELKRHLEDGISADKDIFAEQRSNILLMASEHYSKRGSKFYNRIRQQKDLAAEQKIRLTQNHMYKIIRSYDNVMGALAPGVTCLPQNKEELSDVKSAELHEKVRKWAKGRYRMREKTRDWQSDHTTIGEVGCLVYFDPTKGDIVGYDQEVDEKGQPVFEADEEGNYLVDEEGNQVPKASDTPVYSGDFVFETFYGFNLIREKEATSMEDSKRLTIRQMVSVSEQKKKYAKNKEKLKCFETTQDGTYIIFDSNSASYSKSKDQCQINKTFYRPCMEWPNGYFCFWTENGVFEQGELPFGVWPIAFAPFDKFQTSPRGRSHIKIFRPFQAEINRCASKMAEHQTTLGDDKVITMAGTKLQEGGTLPGIRGIVVNGAAPTILAGRDGSQYLGTMSSKISEMWSASLIPEEVQDKGQMDPWAIVHKSASQKVKFKLYVERFEQFLIDVHTIFFSLARHYLSDDQLMEILGPNEQMNWDEFRSPKKLGYLIEVEAMSDDIDTQYGQQLVMNHIMQYAGQQLSKEDLGQVIENMPFANAKRALGDLTLNYRKGTNVILALDKGRMPKLHPNDDHAYMIKRLNSRMSEPDFDFLDQNVQMGYQAAVAYHQQNQAQIEAKLLAQQKDFIPTTGAMVAIDLYVPNAKNPQTSKRARIPYDAIQWLIQRMENQGSTLSELEGMNEYNLSQIADHLHGQMNGGALPGAPMPQARMPVA